MPIGVLSSYDNYSLRYIEITISHYKRSQAAKSNLAFYLEILFSFI